MARKPADIVQLNLRFPEALRRRLEREAKQHDRSLNMEIVERLGSSFDYDQLRRDAENLVRDPSFEEDAYASAPQGMVDSMKSLFQMVAKEIALRELAALRIKSKKDESK